MAVSAFYNDRDRKGPDMECNPHEPHPLPGGVADRLPFVQRLALILPDPTEKSMFSGLDFPARYGILNTVRALRQAVMPRTNELF